ncbi:MAG: hypothetical protein ABJC39_08595 [Chloroflexota bacterium]
MADPPERPTREDAVDASLFAFLKRYGLFIAIGAPLIILSPVVKGGVFVLVVALMWLGEAIVYAAVRRRGRGVRSDPAPALQALWIVFAVLAILGGLFGLAVGQPAAILAFALGAMIVAWVWRRVARASGEDSRDFVARIAGTIARSGALVIGSLVLGAIAQALGLPGMILVILAVAAGFGLLLLILSRMPR